MHNPCTAVTRSFRLRATPGQPATVVLELLRTILGGDCTIAAAMLKVKIPETHTIFFLYRLLFPSNRTRYSKPFARPTDYASAFAIFDRSSVSFHESRG